MSQDPAGWYHLIFLSQAQDAYSWALLTRLGFCPRSSGDMTPDSLRLYFTTALYSVKLTLDIKKQTIAPTVVLFTPAREAPNA